MQRDRHEQIGLTNSRQVVMLSLTLILVLSRHPLARLPSPRGPEMAVLVLTLTVGTSCFTLGPSALKQQISTLGRARRGH